MTTNLSLKPFEANDTTINANRHRDQAHPSSRAVDWLNFRIERKATPMFDRIGSKTLHRCAGWLAILFDDVCAFEIMFTR